MTCLYCGKKLGFFSRYKDTPFCSEDHLRQHQDELEKALMERLGSKASQQAKPGGKNAPPPVSERQPNLRADKPAARVEEKPPAPLFEEFFVEASEPLEVLDTKLPMIAPTSYAIIVQADCCTPQSPELLKSLEPELEEMEFVLTETSIEASHWKMGAAAIEMHGEDTFGEPWVFLPEAIQRPLETPLSLIEDLEDLCYEAELDGAGTVSAGIRPEREFKPRLRLPMCGRDIMTGHQSVGSNEDIFELHEVADFVFKAPAAPVQTIHEAFEATEPPVFRVVFRSGDTFHDFSPELQGETEPLSLHLVTDPQLADHQVPSLDNLGAWATEVIGPKDSFSAIVPAGFRGRQELPQQRPVRPVPFPALFQFASKLPAKPEVSAQ